MSASSSDLVLPSEIGTATTPAEADVVARIATHAARPTVVTERQVLAYVVPEGSKVERVIGDEPRAAPDRKKGTADLLDADSFAAYLLKHQQGDATEIYADPAAPTVIGVLNGNGPTADADVDPELGWGDHRVRLVFRNTPAWTRWAGADGKLMTQVQFAEHVEQSLPDIVEPEGALMLELAQTFQATTKVDFESATDLQSGQAQLVYREKVDAGAGAKGGITIPKQFVIGVAPYEGSPLYRVAARLRYRIGEGRLQIGYQLDRPEDVLREAFNDVLGRIQEETGRIALLGSPPG